MVDAAIGYPMIPLLRPFYGSFLLENIMKPLLGESFSSCKKISKLTIPILLLHGKRDFEIPLWHAKSLFYESIHGRMSLEPFHHWNVRDHVSIIDSLTRSRPKKNSMQHVEQLITKTLLPGIYEIYKGEEGELWNFDDKSNPIWFLQVEHAGHNDLSQHQLTQDTIESWLNECNTIQHDRS
jgi:hypothetical protein